VSVERSRMGDAFRAPLPVLSIVVTEAAMAQNVRDPR
jgi:hypothetical protein